MMIATVYDDRLILFRTSHELFTTTLAECFYQHVKLFALILLVLLCADFSLQFDELVQSVNLGVLRYIAWLS